MDAYDRETGEVHEPSVAARALEAAQSERATRRNEARGVGLVGIYSKLATAYDKIDPVMILDADGHHNKPGTGQKRKYTSYAALIRAVRAPLLEEGILIRHRTDRVFQMGDGQGKTTWLTVITDLIDSESGEVISSELALPIVRTDPQAVGIAMSYGKRYTLISALGIASGDQNEDDDAEGAMPRNFDGEAPADKLIREIRATKSVAEFTKWRKDADKALEALPEDDFEKVKQAGIAHRSELIEAESGAEPDAPKTGAQRPANGRAKSRIAATNDGGTA